MSEDFVERCLDAGCVVAPVRLYDRYDANGNTTRSVCLGVRYAVFEFHNEAVSPDYYIDIEQCQSGIQKLYATPEAALRSVEQRHSHSLTRVGGRG